MDSFYNDLDLKRVEDGILWFFKRHLIIFHRLEKGEDPSQVLVLHTNFWVQIHNLPPRCMSEGMARQLGNFIRIFTNYNRAIVTRGIRKFMRIKVKMDVRCPLKRKSELFIGKTNLYMQHSNMKNYIYFVYCVED